MGYSYRRSAMSTLVRTTCAVVTGLLVLAASSPASAKPKWSDAHPRRAEVNDRLNHQNARIKEGVKSGKLTHEQAQQLHREDKAVRQEERQMAAQHHGHITKAEQHKLNRQENAVSGQIHEEKHP